MKGFSAWGSTPLSGQRLRKKSNYILVLATTAWQQWTCCKFTLERFLVLILEAIFSLNPAIKQKKPHKLHISSISLKYSFTPICSAVNDLSFSPLLPGSYCVSAFLSYITFKRCKKRFHSYCSGAQVARGFKSNAVREIPNGKRRKVANRLS